MTYKNEFQYILHLLRCAVSDEIPPNPKEDLDWEVIFKITGKHKIHPTIFFGIQKLPSAIQQHIPHFNDYFTAYQKNLILDTNRTFEIDILKNEFEKNNVDYVLLKGSVTKYLYPDTSMRVMSDIDIFYRTDITDTAKEKELIISLMEKNGYKIWSREPMEISFYKPLTAISRNMRIEMQKALMDQGYDVWFQYLENIWDRLIQKNSSHEYVMSNEDFYIYHIIHMAKHFKNGGIGIVHVLDIWMMINAYKDFDRNYVNRELKKIDLLQFEHTARLLADYWFNPEFCVSNEYEKDTLDLMETYIISGGAFGTKLQQETNRIADRNDTKVSLFKKIFPEKAVMIDYYGDILKKHPLLLPFYYVKLNFKRIFLSGKNTGKSYKAIRQITDENITKTKDLMNRCGL